MILLTIKNKPGIEAVNWLDLSHFGRYSQGMDIENYIAKKGLNYSKFANMIGVDAKTIARYAHGDRIPTRQIMSAIFAATDGTVRPEDFYDLPNV